MKCSAPFLISVFGALVISRPHAFAESAHFSRLGEIPIPAEIAAAGKPSGPGRNDVTMRTLSFRRVPAGSEKDPFAAAENFYITRLDWTYLTNHVSNPDHMSDRRQDDKKSVQRILDMGIAFGGAGADNFRFQKENIEQQREHEKPMAMVDLNAAPIIMPVTRNWKTPFFIGDPSNPLWLQDNIDYYKYIVDCGATSLQRDNLNSDYWAVVRQGGGFSESAVKGFNAWLKKNVPPDELKHLGIEDVEKFDYRKHLQTLGAPVGDDFAKFNEPIKRHWINYWHQISHDAWKHIVAEVKSYAKSLGLEVTFSTNNTSLQLMDSIYLLNDFLMSELLCGTAGPVNLHARTRLARSHGKVQVSAEPKPSGVDGVTAEQQTTLTRRVIATTYSLGGLCQVPWDTFLGSKDGAARHFGKPQDYADLYAFVRGNDWQNYEEVAAAGPGLSATSPELGGKVSTEGGSGHVYSFLNRHRSDAQQPLLLFLVDWGQPLVGADPQKSSITGPDGEVRRWGKGSENIKRGACEPFTLVLDNAFHVEPEKVEFVLLEPQPYQANLYVPASQVKDYDVFVKKTVLQPNVEADGQIRLEIPRLNPWGILEISHRPAGARRPTAPSQPGSATPQPAKAQPERPATDPKAVSSSPENHEFMDSAQ